MIWADAIAGAIQYIEEHITENLTTEEIAKSVYLSPFYFQKGFTMMCGFTVSEYIRNRRLALAGSELLAGNERIIDIALKYGYDSPDSFTKAFTRFHGVTPACARKDHATLKSFAPLKVKISLEGGYLMDYRIEKKEAFTVIADAKSFSYDEAPKSVPLFWQEHHASGKGSVVKGMYGINIDEKMGHDTFEYLIADDYAAGAGENVPKGLTVRTIPAFTWAVFPIVGPMPTAFRDASTKIFTEWLPALKEYEFAAGYCIEKYDNPAKYADGILDKNYRCEMMIPVKKK